MNSKQTEQDYVPYGPEWEKEMSKFPKAQLVKMLGKAYQEKKELKQSLPAAKPVSEDVAVTEQEISSLRWLLNVSSEKSKTQLFTALDNCCDKEGVSNRNHLESLWNKLKSGYAAAPAKGIPDEIYNDIANFFKYAKYRGPYTIQKYGGSMIVKFMDGSKAKCSIQMWQGAEVVADESPSDSEPGDGWISVEGRLPTMLDGNVAGYVMSYRRTDRQWGWPTEFGFSKWDRVTRRTHTHWQPLPAAPIQKTVK